MPLPKVPRTRKAINLPDSILDSYAATYELAPTFSIVVTRNGNRLFAQATGQPRFELLAERADAFFLTVIDAQIMFERDGAGVVTGMVLHQNGQRTLGRSK